MTNPRKQAKKGGSGSKGKGKSTGKRPAKPVAKASSSGRTGLRPGKKIRGSGGGRGARAAQAPQKARPGGADRSAGPRELPPLLPVEPRPEDPKSRAEALRAVDAALEKKCVEPVLLDVRALASYTDYILVVSGRSDRQVQAIGEGIIEAMAQHGKRPIGSEGLRDGQWSLVDFGDLIVHVFYHPVREFYDLEGLWSDAPRIPLVIPPEARAHYQDSYAP